MTARRSCVLPSFFPWSPEQEDHRRDALLPDLRYRMRGLGIAAEPEGRYASEKRADIRVSGDGFNVPVEIIFP